jgi:hypothetical protein
MRENDKIERYNAWMRWLKPVLVLGIIALLAGVLFFNTPGFAPKLDSKITYYAVAFTNGQMFYGHPESVGKGVVVLTDVYYVVRQANPKTNEVRNSLVSRRKSEWHSPDRIILNATNILLMEPVDPASSVAKLIAEQRTKGE